MTWKITLAFTCLLAGIATFFVYIQQQPDNTPEIDAPPRAIAPLQAPIEKPDIEEPESAAQAIDTPVIVEQSLEPLIDAPKQLDNSDTQVKKVISDIAPKLAAWLIPEQQIRKWVLAVDLMADGELPKKYPPINFPMATFKTNNIDELTTAAKTNHARTEPLISAITAIDPQLVARYYHHWLPIFEQAYSEQGKPGSFDQRVREAIARIQNVEPPSDSAALIRPHVFYQYEDPKLEQQSDLDKLMWRLGSTNIKRVQSYLATLQEYL